MVFVKLSAEFAYLMANEMCYYYKRAPMERRKLYPICSEGALSYKGVNVIKIWTVYGKKECTLKSMSILYIF